MPSYDVARQQVRTFDMSRGSGEVYAVTKKERRQVIAACAVITRKSVCVRYEKEICIATGYEDPVHASRR